MNKDQIKGTIKTTEGKIQEKVGKFVGSKNQQAKGLAKQGAGKAEENIGDAIKLAKDAKKSTQ